MRQAIRMVLVFAVTACGGKDSGTGPTGTTFQAAQLGGTWVFTPQQTVPGTPCAGAAPNTDIILAFWGHDNYVSNAGVLSFGDGTWESGDSVSGTVNLNTGAIDWRLVNHTTNQGAELKGTLDANLTFTGTFTDALSGYQPYLTSDTCTLPATGFHVQ